MLTKKQQIFFNSLIKYYQDKKCFPTLNEIKKITNIKYYNSLYVYLNFLEKKGYIKYDYDKKQITYLKTILLDDNISIPFIDEFNYLRITNQDYYSYKVKDNNLKKLGIEKNNILIIEKNTNFLNNKLVLVYLNNHYQIYKYVKENCFHKLVNDKEAIYIENTNIIIGKVKNLIKNF